MPAESPSAIDAPQRLQQAGLDLLDQGYAVFDVGLKLLAWNRTFLRLAALAPERAYVGSPFAAFVAGEPEAAETLAAARAEAARTGGPQVHELQRPDGRILQVRDEALPQGGLLTVYTDITEERYLENLIQHQSVQLDERVRRRTAQLENANANLLRANADKSRMQAALVQAQKMEAIGQLTGGLAHDFNNLLTVVIGNLAALQDRRAGDAEVGEFVEPALQSARRGVQLIKRLLTFSRQQPLEPRTVDVGRLIRDMATLVRRSLPESIAIVTDLPAAPLYACVDHGQLESALLNFALNARDAMPEGGRLDMAARPLELAAEAAEFEVATGSYVQIEVADNGTGMDAATLARVFEPFFTTKRFGLGSGLGLSMVHEFVRQSGGGIRIRSQPGQGSRVLMVLPQGQPGADDHAPGDELPLASGGELVLLVEDEESVRRVVRQQLIDLGHPVIEAENGSQALELLANVPDIAIVVSDVVMPGGIDGRQLAGQLRERRPAIRVVLISGYADGEGGDSGRRSGERLAVLAKPFGKRELARALRGERSGG